MPHREDSIPVTQGIGPVDGGTCSGALLVWPLLGHNRSGYRADLQADAAIDTGVEIDPIERCALAVGAAAGIDAGHRAGIDAIGHTLADIGEDGVGHGLLKATLILGKGLGNPKGRATPPADGLLFRLGGRGAGAAQQFCRLPLAMEAFELVVLHL